MKEQLSRTSIQSIFENAVQVSGAKGVQISVVKEDQQFDFCHGVANAELDLPMTNDTLIQLGSTTKLLNAMLVMMLVDEGKVDLDAPIQKYLPDLKLADDQATRQISLRQVLSMTSGLDNGDYADFGPGDGALGRRIASLKDLPQMFPPGEGFGYSNAGSDIAGYVAERVTGQFWNDLLTDRILAPAGLENSACRTGDYVYHRLAVGHIQDPETMKLSVIRPWAISRGLAPAGSTMLMSAHDLAWFGRLFLDKGVAQNGNRIISETRIDQMMSAQVETPTHYYGRWWCLGPHKGTVDGVDVWGHPGGNMSGCSILTWIPEKKGVIAITMNDMGGALSVFARVLVGELFDYAFGLSVSDVEVPSRPVEVPNPERYIGVYAAVGITQAVMLRDDNLVMQVNVSTPEAPSSKPVIANLIPLGGERFLIDQGQNQNELVRKSETAFFGNDDAGRATNMLAGVFPLRRQGS